MSSFLKKPFILGNLVLPSNIFCAPLAGCSDLPFRRMTSHYRPGLIFCEMVKMEPLVRQDPHTLQYLDYEKDMHPIGAQICGSNTKIAGQAAKIIEDKGFDLVDLNCGCPVDKVTKDGSGSGMLKTPELIGEILSNMIAAVKIPVTVKIRLGWDLENINALEVTKIAKQAGAVAITIHGRTRAQGYKGPAEWSFIRACKEIAGEMKVIGNGDAFTPQSAQALFQQTSCDGILLARGIMGKPWLIEDIYRYLQEGVLTERGSLDYRRALLKHVEHVLDYRKDRKVITDLRRIGCWYLKGNYGVRQLRGSLNQAQSIEEIQTLFAQVAWDDLEFSSENIEEN